MNPLSGKHGFIDAYDPEYTKKIAYFSDSCGAWRDTTYQALVEGHLPPRLQFLFHPIFWRNSPPVSRWTCLEDLERHHINAVRRRTEDVVTIWRNHTGVREHEARAER